MAKLFDLIILLPSIIKLADLEQANLALQLCNEDGASLGAQWSLPTLTFYDPLQ